MYLSIYINISIYLSIYLLIYLSFHICVEGWVGRENLVGQVMSPVPPLATQKVHVHHTHHRSLPHDESSSVDHFLEGVGPVSREIL